MVCRRLYQGGFQCLGVQPCMRRFESIQEKHFLYVYSCPRWLLILSAVLMGIVQFLSLETNNIWEPSLMW